MVKCKYCRRNVIRSHARHDTFEIESLCELHYARWHPTIVLSRLRDEYPWRIKERKALLDELRKYVDPETIDQYLGDCKWYRNLRSLSFKQS